ncbi:hypothetical protein [Shinella oryzae]|uniref:hypothetical protein n=1 Tax=Shinella oryzae TaxID=2871820 RepID=UPI001FF522CB|nr:hypothetical protein [Shinella oryzae]UPA23213.1 hypothetical protein K6301_08325 [Shinella oryzae]
MADKTWQDFEKNVRLYAKAIWGTEFRSQMLYDRQIDAYSELNSKSAVAIEVTEQKNINKIQDDINKLYHVRANNFSSKFISTECFIVVGFEPTPAMIGACSKVNIDVLTVEEFKSRFLPYEEYRSMRILEPFGSAIDPESGSPDTKAYVEVDFLRGESAYSRKRIYEDISSGKSVVLLGEYGTGKSKFFENAFHVFSKKASFSTGYPLAIDLRKSWGLNSRYEIITRHLTDLGMSFHADKFIKAYNEGLLFLFIDGFDEVGSQAWSDNPESLKNLRADALQGVRDLISNQKSGLIICGREHYFDSNDEMFSALGLINRNPILVQTKGEFSVDEIQKFVQNSSISISIPDWLPRKPLTCDFFVRTFAATEDKARFDADTPHKFWDIYVSAVCEREARLNSAFDADSIRSVLVAIAAITRRLPQDVGPITLAEIRDAFQRAVGYAPIDQASVLLQRLSGLGRSSADTEDRRFVDTYLLDGLRAVHVVEFVTKIANDAYLDEDWLNPLGEYGLDIASQKIADLGLSEEAVLFCRSAIRKRNHTLIADVVGALLLSGQAEIDFGGLHIKGAQIGCLDFSEVDARNLIIETSTVDELNVPLKENSSIVIIDCHVNTALGISAESGMPNWIKDTKIENYTSIATTSRIKSSDISNNHKVLVAILHKTFFQPGSARKEEALFRGLGKIARPKTVSSITNKLISEEIVSQEKGNSGDIFVPNRAKTKRVAKIMAELNMSTDPIWRYVDSI